MLHKKIGMVFLVTMVFQLNAWNYPPSEQEKMERYICSTMQALNVKNPGDASLVTHEIYARYILANGVVPSQDAKMNVLKGVAKRIAKDELSRLETPWLTKQQRAEVLAKQEENIDRCGSEGTLAHYFDRETQKKRLQQGIQGKMQNGGNNQLSSVWGDCSNCYEQRLISPYSCGNSHDKDTWACLECQALVKKAQGKCPFCRASLR